MKITRRQLRQIIKEEISLIEADDFDSAGWPNPGTSADIDRGAPRFIYTRGGTKKVYSDDEEYDSYPKTVGYTDPKGEKQMIVVNSLDDMNDILDLLAARDIPYSVD